jgi:circadian clock protein KaiB
MVKDRDKTKRGGTRKASAQPIDNSEQKYILRLYVSGTTPRSLRTIENLKTVCREHLQGRYELEVIDLYQQPELLKKDQIVAVPTLIKELPPPLKKFIGDLSDLEQVLVGLGLQPKKDDTQ